MTKKSLNKLLSVILTLAICSATVFGCLITANADSVDCYEWSEGSVSENLTSATIDLTFTAPSNLPEGIVVGRFNLNADENLVLNTIAVTGGVRVDGADFSANDFLDEDGNTVSVDKGGKYLFAPTSPYSSVTLTLTFGFSGDAAVSGTYAVNIGDVFELTGPRGDSQYIDNGTGNSGLFKTGCDHVFDVTDLDPVQTNAAEGYYVYKNVPCKNCGIVNPYQVVPATELKSTVYWDGINKNKPTTLVDGTYIISTAEELAWIVSQTSADATLGKNYKVDDGIDAIVLQPKSSEAKAIMDLADYAQTKAYFEKTLSQKVNWVTTQDTVFAGTFDGNGVEIYGQCGSGVNGGSQGIFGMVVPGATFKNFAVKNSYLYKASGKAGAIFGGVNATANGTVTIENVIVSGCYLWAGEPNDNYGIMVGSTASVIKTGLTVKNCLVHSNTFYYAEDTNKKCGIVGTMSDIDPEIPSGKTEIEEKELGADNQFENCIILDCAPYSVFDNNNKPLKALNYKNMYTNGIDPNDNKTWPCLIRNNIWDYTWNNYADKIISINRSDVKGNSAVISALNEANESTVWYADPNGGYPSLVTGSNSTSQNISTTTQYNLNLKAANIDYNKNDGSFNFNFYYEPTAEDLTPVLYVGQADVSGFHKLTGTVITQEMIDATQAYLDAGLVAGTLRYTIKNISAREIGDTLLPTAVAKNGTSTVWGKTEQISVADYANKVMNSTDAKIKAADKQVAAALVNYGTAAATALATAAPSATGKKVVYTTTTNKEPDSTFTDGTHGAGTEADPYIISTPGQLRYIVQNSTTESTKGKFYKIDPTIGTMVMQTESYINTVAYSLDAFLKLDAAGTSAALSNSTNRTRWNSGSNNGYDGFAGTIDFSGVTICGMYNENGGLFAVTREATIKNLIVSNNYITSDWYNGNVVGMVRNESATEYTKLTLSNIIVKNCYQHTTANGYANTGVLVGTMQHANKVRLDVRNILTYGNISKGTNSSTDSTLKDCALFGTLQSSWNGDSNVDNYGEDDNAYLEDIVTLDCVPYPTQTVNNHMTKKAYWHDSIYTTHYYSNCAPNTAPEAELSAITAIKQISASNAEGGAAVTAMPDLDWISTWTMGTRNDYPSPIPTVATLKESKTIYWDGTTDSNLADNGEAGTAEDPIIIDSAAELHQLARNSTYASTNGKYYKVADGISKIVLQPEGNEEILTLANAAAVENYFSNTSGKNLQQWAKGIGYRDKEFCGNFDGNGVEIYGMYQTATDNTNGLFPLSDAGAVFKNFALKNSYVANTSTNFSGAFVIGKTPGAGIGANADGIITVENVAVINNYMNRTSNNHNHAGVLTGELTDTALVKNCLIYGNDATYTYNDVTYDVPMASAAHGGMGYQAYMEDMGVIKNGNYACYTVRNSIILGTSPYNLNNSGWRFGAPNCYSGVYADTMPELKISGNVQTFTATQIKKVNAADLIGEGGKATVDALNTANGGATVWYTGNPFDGYPSLKPAGSMPTAYQAVYDAVDFTSYNIYTGSNDQFGVYTTSLNLKNNPYLSIVFAFGKEGDVNYKENRNAIQVKVTGASGKVLYDSEELDSEGRRYKAIPEYVEGEYISGVNGWTNKKNAGRFHTLKLDAPIYELCGEITVTITYGGKTVTNKVSVSGFGNELLNSYKRNPSDYYLNCAEAVKALLFYTQSLKARYGTKAQ